MPSNRFFGGLLSPASLVLWLALGAMLAFAGPFGTYQVDGVLYRFAYWFTVVILGVIYGRYTRLAVDYLLPTDPMPAADLLATSIMAVCFTPVLWFLTARVFWAEQPDVPGFTRFLVYVVIISLMVGAARRALPSLIAQSGARAPAAPLDAPRLYRRLPGDFEGPVLRLTVQDHMVDVVTPRSTHSIRMRLSDAISEMDTVAGYSTHRSHWVARKAIDQVQRQNGRIRLLLTNGDVIPVSRKYKAELEAAGVV